MKYIVAENYLCFLALLEMIIQDFSKSRCSQIELAEIFGITVPCEYKGLVKNITYTSEENNYGVHLTQDKLQAFLVSHNIPLNVRYISSCYLSEMDIDYTISKLQKEYKYIIFTYSYGALYKKSEYMDLGHVGFLESIKNDTVLMYDPGPSEPGIKEINVDDLFYAMKKKGGIYVFIPNKCP